MGESDTWESERVFRSMIEVQIMERVRIIKEKEIKKEKLNPV